MRTCAAFALHLHELDLATQAGDEGTISRAINALLSIARIVIYATKAAFEGVPMDFDGLAFWCHRIVVLSALVHIQFEKRTDEWESDLEILKTYLRYYAPRFKLHGMKLCPRLKPGLIQLTANYLKEIEAAEHLPWFHDASNPSVTST